MQETRQREKMRDRVHGQRYGRGRAINFSFSTPRAREKDPRRDSQTAGTRPPFAFESRRVGYMPEESVQGRGQAVSRSSFT